MAVDTAAATDRSVSVVVQMSEEVYEALVQLAERQKKSFDLMLLDALRLELYVADVLDNGGQVLVKKKGGEYRELLSA